MGVGTSQKSSSGQTSFKCMIHVILLLCNLQAKAAPHWAGFRRTLAFAGCSLWHWASWWLQTHFLLFCLRPCGRPGRRDVRSAAETSLRLQVCGSTCRSQLTGRWSIAYYPARSHLISLVCVLPGLLQECAGAKGAAWTRARSVLATQHSRSTRQHRVSWDPRVKGSSNDQVCKPASALAQNSALRHGWS